MSKKDYELIARVLRSRVGYFTSRDGQDALAIVARDFASELQTTNPRFDRARFLQACGVEA